ncbi:MULTISPECIES: hypothetical protein [Bacteria]|uniref:hypothetical protein n=1 Tax=Bacteria TaxID=2 RepID=UPI003C7AECAE
MPVYSKCSSCGAEFESRAVTITGNVKNVTLSNINDRCPVCKRHARAMEGNFDFDPDGRTTMLSGPEWSRSMVERMQRQFREIDEIARSPERTDEEARQLVEDVLAEIEKTNPVVAREYRRQAEALAEVPERSRMSKVATAMSNALRWVGYVNDVDGFVGLVQRLISLISG